MENLVNKIRPSIFLFFLTLLFWGTPFDSETVECQLVGWERGVAGTKAECKGQGGRKTNGYIEFGAKVNSITISLATPDGEAREVTLTNLPSGIGFGNYANSAALARSGWIKRQLEAQGYKDLLSNATLKLLHYDVKADTKLYADPHKNELIGDIQSQLNASPPRIPSSSSSIPTPAQAFSLPRAKETIPPAPRIPSSSSSVPTPDQAFSLPRAKETIPPAPRIPSSSIPTPAQAFPLPRAKETIPPAPRIPSSSIPTSAQAFPLPRAKETIPPAPRIPSSSIPTPAQAFSLPRAKETIPPAPRIPSSFDSETVECQLVGWERGVAGTKAECKGQGGRKTTGYIEFGAKVNSITISLATPDGEAREVTLTNLPSGIGFGNYANSVALARSGWIKRQLEAQGYKDLLSNATLKLLHYDVKADTKLYADPHKKELIGDIQSQLNTSPPRIPSSSIPTSAQAFSLPRAKETIPPAPRIPSSSIPTSAQAFPLPRAKETIPPAPRIPSSSIPTPTQAFSLPRARETIPSPLSADEPKHFGMSIVGGDRNDDFYHNGMLGFQNALGEHLTESQLFFGGENRQGHCIALSNDGQLPPIPPGIGCTPSSSSGTRTIQDIRESFMENPSCSSISNNNDYTYIRNYMFGCYKEPPNCDPKPNITGDANLRNIERYFNELMEKDLKPNDRVYLHLVDHGTSDHGITLSRGNEIIELNYLREKISQLRQKGVHIQLNSDACYSGGITNMIHQLNQYPDPGQGITPRKLCSTSLTTDATYGYGSDPMLQSGYSENYIHGMERYKNQLSAFACGVGSDFINRPISSLDNIVIDWSERNGVPEIEHTDTVLCHSTGEYMDESIATFIENMGEVQLALKRRAIIDDFKQYFIQPFKDCWNRDGRKDIEFFKKLGQCVKRENLDQDLEEFFNVHNEAAVTGNSNYTNFNYGDKFDMDMVNSHLKMLTDPNTTERDLNNYLDQFCCLAYNFETKKGPSSCQQQ